MFTFEPECGFKFQPEINNYFIYYYINYFGDISSIRSMVPLNQNYSPLMVQPAATKQKTPHHSKGEVISKILQRNILYFEISKYCDKHVFHFICCPYTWLDCICSGALRIIFITYIFLTLSSGHYRKLYLFELCVINHASDPTCPMPFYFCMCLLYYAVMYHRLTMSL